MSKVLVNTSEVLAALPQEKRSAAQSLIRELLANGVLRPSSQPGTLEFSRTLHAYYFWAEAHRLRADALSDTTLVKSRARRRAIAEMPRPGTSPGLPASSKPLVVVVYGPSGVGKDSVVHLLCEQSGFYRAAVSTSRIPRPEEPDGLYHFLLEDEFRARLARGDFLEWERVYGDYKGVERREVEGPLRANRDVVIRTDVQGARRWREKLDGAVFICLMAEDREALINRLQSRGGDDRASMEARIALLEAELNQIEPSDSVVVVGFGQTERAVEEIEVIVARVRKDPAHSGTRLRV